MGEDRLGSLGQRWRDLHRPASSRYLARITGIALIFCSAALAALQNPAPTPEISPQPTQIPPRTWAKDATTKALENLHRNGLYLRYHMHLVDAKGDRVRDMIESRDGNVARLIRRDGNLLTAEQDKDERQRLNDMLGDPEGFAKHAKGDEAGRKIADNLIRLMPEAMLYTYVTGQPQTGKKPDITEVVIDFEPDPKFQPPTTTAEALTGLKGRAWVDIKSKQIVRMEGTIFKGINFGWGMLAHIYPGGHLVFEQTDAGNGRWTYSYFSERISVRALMVKSLNINADISVTDIQPARSMSYQEAVHLLLDTPLPTR